MTLSSALVTRRSLLKGRLQDEGSGHVAFITATCLARSGIDCQACRDRCPSEAIRFVPRRGGPFMPAIDDNLCTGCGACLSSCPTTAIHLGDLRTLEVGYG